jgi:hypothetical protein
MDYKDIPSFNIDPGQAFTELIKNQITLKAQHATTLHWQAKIWAKLSGEPEEEVLDRMEEQIQDLSAEYIDEFLRSLP